MTATDNVALSSTVSGSVTVDNTAPAASDVQSGNGGGTAGRIQVNDSMIYTFTEAIDPASVMTGWTGASSAVSLRFTTAGGGDYVRVYDAANSTLLPLNRLNFGGTRLHHHHRVERDGSREHVRFHHHGDDHRHGLGDLGHRAREHHELGRERRDVRPGRQRLPLGHQDPDRRTQDQLLRGLEARAAVGTMLSSSRSMGSAADASEPGFADGLPGHPGRPGLDPLILWLGAAVASTARATAPRRSDSVTT